MDSPGAARAGAAPSVRLGYRCPRCKGPLLAARESFRCEACAAEYPVVLGIPDFRVFPDPFLAPADDWAKARRLQERAEHTDFRGVLEYYWSITPDEPEDLVRRYVRYDLAGVARGRHLLETIEAERPGAGARMGRALLELGCRTGGLLVAAAEKGAAAVGIDLAFRWLVVARKRLEEQGLDAQLVCCCAQALPFADESVDLVVAGNVIEHTHAQQPLLDETHRVLRRGGTFFALTCNRYSLAPEPHVRLFGVGLLPRRWQSAYVRWRRGHPYANVRLVSAFELRRLLARARFDTPRIGLPSLSDSEQEGLSERERGLVRGYHRVKDWPLLRALLLVFGPLLQVLCVRPAGDRARA